MPSKQFDARPRDDVYPSSEELRRAQVPQQLNPEELLGPDYALPEDDSVTRAKMPTASWPAADKDAPDYAHLEPQGREPVVGDKKFKITGADIERNLIDDEDHDKDGVVDGVDHIKLEETRPDHKNFRCTIGYYHPGTRKFSAFRASTVPAVTNMTNYYQWYNGLGGDRSKGAVNLLPTGCYVFRVGTHGGGKIVPALRLTDSVDFSADGAATVLRSKKDMIFTTTDDWETAVTQDHVHCAYYEDKFDSAGCLTVQGTKQGDGPWGPFQTVLKRFKSNTRIDLMLLTGRDASIAAYLGTTGRADDSDYAERLLSRLRPGSTGDAVSRLQAALGVEQSGYFGPGTKAALVKLQAEKSLTMDGIWSPALEDKLGWAVLKPAVAVASQPEPAAQPEPKPVAVPVQQPAAVAQPVAAASAPPKPTVPTPAPVTPAAVPPQTVTASAPPAAPKPPLPTPAQAPVQVAMAAATAAPSAPLASAQATGVVAPAGGDAAAADTRQKSAMAQFNTVRPSAGPVLATAATATAAASAMPPAARAVSPGLGAVAQRTSPTPAAPAPSQAPAPMIARPAAAPPLAAPIAPVPIRAAPAPAPSAAQPVAASAGPLIGAPKLVITPDTLQVFAPNAVAQYRDALLNGNDLLTRYKINMTPLRFCHFLGQIGNECGRLSVLEENLGYRSAERIRAVWPTRFPTLASAQAYVNEPQRLADRVYGDRFDNGPGDGWRYRGRGLVQLTGRSSYRNMGAKLAIPLEEHPDLALDARYALAIACETWAGNQLAGERDMNKLADCNKLEALTYRINGGYTNIDDRRAAFEHAWEVWSSGDPPKRMLDPDVLDRGDRGGRVDELNARLKDFGLFGGITEDPPQHVYSICTYKAVRILQAESGLPETGIMGPETWSALEHAAERGLTTRGRGTSGAEPDAKPKRHVVARRLAEIRFWAIMLSVVALAYVVTHIFLLTHPTGNGNAVLWLPMLFSGAVFVAGMALWLAARPQPHWQVPTPRGTVRTMARRGPSSYISGEEEPVRHGINL